MRKLIILTVISLLSVLTVVAGVKEVSAHYQRGVELYQAQKFTAAANEFDKAYNALGLDPASQGLKIKIEFYRAICAGETKEPTAIKKLEIFLAENPNSVYNNDIRYMLGRANYEAKDYDKALTYFMIVNPFELGSDKTNEYYFKIAHTLFLSGDYDKAYGYFNQIDKQSTYAPHSVYHVSYIDYTRENYNVAKEGFLKLVNNEVYAKIVPFYILQIEFLQNNFRYVVEHGDALLASAAQPRSTEIARLMSESWYRLGDYPKALDYMEKFRSLGGVEQRNEYYIVGYSSYMLKKYRQAADALVKVCGVDDDLSQSASYHLADCYLNLGDKRAAMLSFSIAAAGGADKTISEDALFNYGKLQYELGGGVFNEAINILNKYINDYPSSARVPQVREYLIAAYYNSRNYEAAYEAIKLFKNPDNNIKTALQKIAYFRALEYFNAGDFDMSGKLLDQAATYKFNPKYTALTQYWQGEVLYRKGDYKNAIEDFSDYIRLSPASERENIFAKYNIGYSLFNQQKWSDAGEWFNKFIAAYSARDGYKADAYNRLGDVAYSGREFGKATQNYDKAIAIGSEEKYYAKYQRAVILGLEDKTASKIESLKEIIAENKGEYVEQSMYELGRTYIGQEKFSDGAEALKRFVDAYPSSDLYLTALSDLGLIYQNLGNKDQALKYYKMVVSTAPMSPQAKDAMQGIQGVYVDVNEMDSYFDYAKSVGMESDLSVMKKDSLSFASAEKVYLAGDPKRTIPAMKSYLKNYSKGVYRTSALYYVGESALKIKDNKEAVEAFDELSQMHMNEYTARALDRLSVLYASDGSFAKAAMVYKKLSEVATSAADGAKALAGYLKCTQQLADPKRTVIVADEVLSSKFADPDIVRMAKFAKAKAIEASDNYAGAITIFKELATESMTPEGAESTYKTIEQLFNGGEYDKAEKMILNMSEQNSSQAYWLGKAFITLGDIYVKRNDSFQARATFQSIVDGYSPVDDGIVEAAKDRIKSLK